MRCLLSDLHGRTVPRLLGLDEYEVNYVARMDLAAWSERDIKDELRQNYKVYFDCLLAHHFPEGRNMGLSGWCGHHHNHKVWNGYSPILGNIEFHQLGCGHVRDATFCQADKWSNGFLITHVDTHKKRSVLDYITISDFAVIGGKRYWREEGEIVIPH